MKKLPDYCNGFLRTNFKDIVLCPRCKEGTLPFGYPGALSRYDNKTEICSKCGRCEFIEDFSKGPQSLSKPL